MVLCGAFPSLLATRTTSGKKQGRSEEDVPTVFTFQLSPGGSRGSITPGIVDNFSSRSFESTRSSSSSRRSHGEASELSVKRRQPPRHNADKISEFRNVRKALFDAATESESICTDPLLGSVVDIVNDTAGEEQLHNNIDDLPKNCTRRQLLWQVALQHHRSRHGKVKQRDTTQSLKETQLQELDRVVMQQRNNSKESLNTNIRKRGLSNLQQYLPSMSYSAGHDCDIQMNQRWPQQHRKHIAKHCPLCSCRLTYLYYSASTHRLTEIHSGCDTPSSKADSSLPPYCIGCRAYLIYEQWDENQRKMLLKNFENRLDIASPSSHRNDEVIGGPLEDFKNGKIIVVDSSSHAFLDVDTWIDTSISDDAVDQNNHVTPLHRNSSSEVSSYGSNSYNEVCDHDSGTTKFDDEINPRSTLSSALHTNSNRAMKMPEHIAHDEKLQTHVHPYHNKGRIMLNSVEKRESVDSERREDCENANNDYNYFGKEKDVGGLELREANSDLEGDNAGYDVTGYQSDDQSHRDPFVDLNDRGERVPPEKVELTCTNAHPVGFSDSNDMVNAKLQNARGQIPPHPKQSSINSRPPYEVIDQAITFKSPTLAAKALIAEDRLAVASTFSEEFAVFQNYSVKKEAATKQIAKCLHKGYELTSLKCEQCDMPMMTRGEEGAICVSCPAIMKKVRRMVKERRNHLKTSPVVTEKTNHLKTPKTSNTRGNLVHDVGTYDEVAEDCMDQRPAINGRRTDNNARNHSDLFRQMVSGEDEEMKSIVRTATIIPSEGCDAAENLDKIEEGLFGIYNHDTEQNVSNQSVAVNHRDYWVSYTELHGALGPQSLPQPSICSDSLSGVLPISEQRVSYQTDYRHHPFCRGNVHLQDPLANEHKQQNIQDHYSFNTVNVTHELYQNHVHSYQTTHPESKHHHDVSGNECQQKSVQPQSSCHDVNITSVAAGRDYYRNPSLEESVESITKCPRDLPSSEQIWHNNSSEYIMGCPSRSSNHIYASDANQVMVNEGRSVQGNPWNLPIREVNCHRNQPRQGHPSHNISPKQSADRTEKKNVFDLVDAVKSPDDASSFKPLHCEFINTDTSNVQFVEATSHIDLHLLPSKPRLQNRPKNEKTNSPWSEGMPLSFELNSNVGQPVTTMASKQNWSAPQLATADSLTSQVQINAERLALPDRLFEGTKGTSSPSMKPLIREHRNVSGDNKSSPSYFESTRSSPAYEKSFFDRIDNLTNTLKRATNQFESRIVARQEQSTDDHAQQHCWGPVPSSPGEGHKTSPGDTSPDPFSATLQDIYEVSAKSVHHSSLFGRRINRSFSCDPETHDDYQNRFIGSQNKPSLLCSDLRKPLEPIESDNDDEHRRQLGSSVDQRIPRIDIYSSTSHQKLVKIRERNDPVTPQSGTDPPGHKPLRRNSGIAQRPIRMIGNIHSPRNSEKVKWQEPRDQITRNQCGADPPESDYSLAGGTDPESSRDKCVHRGIASTQNINRLPNSPKNRVASPEKKDEDQNSPKSWFTSQQSMIAEMLTSANVYDSSSSYPKPLTSSATKASFQLNIPSWVDDEIDTPIKPVNSFGETSMDRLLRKIDEIENDFSTIVASLPGSDRLSLKLSKSDDNSTLATKSTFEIHQDTEQINHHLASDSFGSHGSQGKLMSGILQQMRLVQHQIEQLECSEVDDCSEGGYESQGEMAELIQKLANAAESLRSLQLE
ncbi:hypothetical protein HJC23_005262 [Cyclotella cryptica]|uniref:Uncharacterized protein n=1 Tax=Cyclotella cryptica TaxID=29204 RepID=A0ABD3PKJ2_9STRA|eukprot:CCRYP_013589-RA/>CCRYP_013589-RA protein AED:0.02 eAED:0.02 QI:0/-1/0/1/-1/1/1/0/1694